MPLTRYQIRNEYSLADPELYLAADKDDPEALLEGVAMAGLVGVLRQLGDLAEFAAEIFHDLHEEVMATAARGHGLMARVQQLEVDFPLIEKAFLSQTSHSAFYYNAGVEWHPNLRMDQNLITQGDLPRFVMDSYEECRGPPRLFILDKFDVAGAGACLKRYTNPSFFKVEAASRGTPNVEIQRDKKIRKVKKKGACWRNGATPEVLPASNAKLHQLFLEERVENGSIDPARPVKLKNRHLNGSPFDPQTGKSYMEKLLQTTPPKQKVVHEISVSPLSVKLSSNSSESGQKILDIQTVSPAPESVERSRRRRVSSFAWETELKPSVGELSDKVIDEGNLKVPAPVRDCKNEGNLKVPAPVRDCEIDEISSTLHKVVNEKKLAFDGEIKTEGSVDGSPSDDVASETDNFMDALATMESELETDTECRPKNDNSKNHVTDSDANVEQHELQDQFSDSQSTGQSNASDDGNISFKKGEYSVYNSDLSYLADNATSDGDKAAEVFPSTESRVVESVNTSSNELSINDEIILAKFNEHSLPNGTCTEVIEVPSLPTEFGEAYCSPCLTDSDPMLQPLDLGACSREVSSVVSELDEMVSDGNECGTGLVNTETNKTITGDLFPTTDTVSDAHFLKNTVSAESLPADDVDEGDSNIFTDALPHLPSDLDLASENKSIEIGVNKVLQAVNNTDNASREFFLSDALAHLSSDSDPAPVENYSENVVNELIQTEYADEDSLENIGSPHSIVSSTKEHLLSSNLPELEPSTGIKVQPNGLPDSIVHCPDAGNPDGTASEVNFTPAAVADLESLIPVVDTPQHNSFSEGNFSEIRDDLLPCELNLTEASGLHSGERTDLEGVCSTTDCEEIEGSTSSVVREEDSVVSLQLSSDYPNYPSPGDQVHEENMVSGTVQAEAEASTSAAAAAVSIDDGGDAIHLSQDIPCSSIKNGVSTQVFLSTLEDSHQKGLDINELSPPECLLESAVQEEVNQSALGPGDADSMPLGAVSCDYSNTKSPNDVPSPSLDVQTQNNLHSDDVITSLTSLKQNNQDTDFLNDISDPSQSTHFPDSLPNGDFTTIPTLSKQSVQDIGSNSPRLTHFSDDSIDAGSVPTSYLPDPAVHLEHALELQVNQLDVECVHADEVIPKFLNPRFEQISDPNHLPQEKWFSASAGSSLDNLPCQASVSEFSLESAAGLKLESSEQDSSLSKSIFPNLGMLSNSSQVSLEEMPPLPPLPPMQWRLGKLQHTSLASGQQSLEHSLVSFPPVVSPPFGFLASEQEIQQTQNPFLLPSDVKDEKLQQVSEHMAGPSPSSMQIPATITDAYNQHKFLALEGDTESLNPFLTPPDISEMPQDGFLALEGERTQLSSNPFSLEPTVENRTTLPLPEKLDLPLNQPPVEKDLEDEKPQHASQNFEGVEMNHHMEVVSFPTIEDQQPQLILKAPGEMSWLSYSAALPQSFENENPNGNTSTKIPRPRNPLIDAVVAHDKSKLRRVTERVQPQIEHKVDERDSLLDQIRTKSFNLKPAVVTRPSIQGPKTNLRVAAILEKANAIRQAFAGSDEDDEDDWSDN